MPQLADADTQIRLGRNWLRAGDPCQWAGHQGYFRFVCVQTPATDERPAVLWLVGPFFKRRPHNPRSRFALADSVRRVVPTDEMCALVARR